MEYTKIINTKMHNYCYTLFNFFIFFLYFKTPDVSVKLPEGGLKLYQPATIKVSFTNPLAMVLTGGKFVLHGEGFVQDVTVDVP